jgi:hypothetical protein
MGPSAPQQKQFEHLLHLEMIWKLRGEGGMGDGSS